MVWPAPGAVKPAGGTPPIEPRKPLDGARFEQQEDHPAGDERQEGEGRRGVRAEGPGQDEVDDRADDRGGQDLGATQQELGDELLHADRSPIARRPWRARMRVTSSAYSRSPPTGMPRAIRVTLPTRSESRSSRYIAVASPSRVGLVARMTSLNGSPSRAAASARSSSSRIRRRSGPTPSIGEIAPWRTWYRPRNSPVR